MTKKVIFVGGTSYSGSTFFDMTLGNDPAGFSLGEVNAYFNPWRPHHVNPLCSCGYENCSIWSALRHTSQEDVYTKIFENFPEIEFIVDSSKDPLWIQQQVAALRRQGLDSRHILMWKTPLEFAHSYQKRNRTGSWQRQWINYHRMYMTLVGDWGAIQYRHYAEDQRYLENACDHLDIPYFPGKERFWERTHHILFGNHSARIHLGDDHRGRQDAHGNHDENGYVSHQQVLYRPIEDTLLERQVAEVTAKSRHIRDILNILEASDVNGVLSIHETRKALSLPSSVCMSRLEIGIRKAKVRIRRLTGRVIAPQTVTFPGPAKGLR